MGVSLNKIAGYGIEGIQLDELNFDNLQAIWHEKSSFTNASYLSYLENLGKLIEPELVLEKMALDRLDPDGFEASRCITFHQEPGAETGILIINPVGMLDSWKRRADPLDSLEDSIRNPNGSHPVVWYFDFPPFPFYGWMNAKTNEDLTDGKSSLITLSRTLISQNESGQFSPEKAEEIKPGLDLMIRGIGFDDVDDFKKNCVPAVPVEVNYLADWAGIFKTEEDNKRLRAMLVTFWE